tara:strand:- start:287 stop:622 length:336 start_codon:yes stop_codon:yes gene_type:complete
MKAQEAAQVAPIINISGLMPRDEPSDAKMGSIIETVAMFDVISVRKLTKTIKSKSKINKGNKPSDVTFNPIHIESPDTLNAFAKESPPPNNKITPHGILTAVSQSKKVSLK